MVLYFDPSFDIEDEREIFDELMQCRNEAFPNTTLRIAGGWVRDKLLKNVCKDIDVALDNCTGYEFAKAFSKWVKKTESKSANLHVIKENPEKSKHLETATMNYKSFSLDFVNLRVDEYTNNSRIPVVKIGTPEKDAYRRDYTINALFYNLNTNKLEDYTDVGIQDFNNKVLRTPIDPHETFMDDPLRLLRGIRFACVLEGFQLHKDIQYAAKFSDVRDTLLHKVSGERILKELEKMLLGDANLCMKFLFYDYCLADILFNQANNIEETVKIFDRLPYIKKCSTWTIQDSCYMSPPNEDIWIPLVYACIFYYTKQPAFKENLLNFLKVTKKTFNRVLTLIEAANNWINVIKRYQNDPDCCNMMFMNLDEIESEDREFCVRVIIRKYGVDLWEPSLILASAVDINYKPPVYKIFELVKSKQLMEWIFMKLAVDGNDIKSTFPSVKGPKIKEYLNFAEKLCIKDKKLFEDKNSLINKLVSEAHRI